MARPLLPSSQPDRRRRNLTKRAAVALSCCLPFSLSDPPKREKRNKINDVLESEKMSSHGEIILHPLTEQIMRGKIILFRLDSSCSVITFIKKIKSSRYKVPISTDQICRLLFFSERQVVKITTKQLSVLHRKDYRNEASRRQITKKNGQIYYVARRRLACFVLKTKNKKKNKLFCSISGPRHLLGFVHQFGGESARFNSSP